MKRFHVHVHVRDPARSLAFHSRLSGTAPVRVEAGHAKWRLDDPRLNFAISTRGATPGVDPLGLQVDDAAELAALKARAQAADQALREEGITPCCGARSDKHGVTDPQGIAWEHGHTLHDIPVFREETASAAPSCCAGPRATANRCG